MTVMGEQDSEQPSSRAVSDFATMFADVAANLASLNDLVALLVRQVSDDPEFVKLVADTLADHTRSLGYEPIMLVELAGDPITRGESK